MILQNIIFPNKSICSEKDLYFHTNNDSFSLLDNGISITEGNRIDFFPTLMGLLSKNGCVIQLPKKYTVKYKFQEHVLFHFSKTR